MNEWINKKVNCYIKSWVKKLRVNSNEEWGCEDRNSNNNYNNI